jgi:TonB family protein
VRCIECVTEPITPGHFCECCGRKLSLEERKGLNTTPVTAVATPEPVAPPPVVPEPVAPGPIVAAVSPAPSPAVPSAPCESCGGPSDDGSLCALCQSAFQALLEGALPKAKESASDDLPATDAEAPPAAGASPASAMTPFGYLSDTASLFSVADVTPGAPPMPTLTAAPVIDEEGLKATEEEAARVEAEEAARMEAARTAVRIEAARLEVEKAEAAKAEAARIEAAREKEKEEAAREEAAKEALRAQAARSKVAENSPRSAPKTATVKPSGAPGRSGRIGSLVGIAAAVAIVASIGLGVGAAWYKIQGILPGQSAPAAAPQPAATVAESVPKAPDPIAVAEAAIKASEAAAAAAERAAAQAQGSAALKAKAAPNAATSRVAPKNVRQPIAPTGQVAAAAAPVAVIEPVRELVAPPPPPPVAVTPAPAVASVEPLRPFFEPKDVNEPPAVANRVEPRLPDELKTRDISEVLVVRLLVSQTGHPSSISLLRRSRTGQTLDDAVVAAIKQWTFSPAKKKGETVSCWMNLGVPVGRAN